jgi:hypothetical protein
MGCIQRNVYQSGIRVLPATSPGDDCHRTPSSARFSPVEPAKVYIESPVLNASQCQKQPGGGLNASFDNYTRARGRYAASSPPTRLGAGTEQGSAPTLSSRTPSYPRIWFRGGRKSSCRSLQIGPFLFSAMIVNPVPMVPIRAR